MSEIPDPHEAQRKALLEKARAGGLSMANAYARVFLGDEDGVRVLADLRTKFGLNRLVFKKDNNGRYDSLSAALIDGERHVIQEIENALMSATNQNIKPKSNV